MHCRTVIFVTLMMLATAGCRESKPSIGVSNIDCSGLWYSGNIKIGKMTDSFGANGISVGVYDVNPGDFVGLELTDRWSNTRISYRGKVPQFDPALNPTIFEICLRRNRQVELSWKKTSESLERKQDIEIRRIFSTIPLLIRVLGSDRYFNLLPRQLTFDYGVIPTYSEQKLDDYLCGYICVEKDASDVMLGIMSTNQGPFRGQMVRLPIDKIMASGVVPDGGIFLDIDAEWKNVKMHRIDQCPDDTLAAGKQMKQGTIKPGELLLELPLQPAAPYTGPTNLTLPDLRFDEEKQEAEEEKNKDK